MEATHAAVRQTRPPRQLFQRWLWRNYNAGWVLLQRLRGRFTRAGMLVLIGALTSGVIGIDTRRTLAYQGFTFLVAVLLVGFVGSRRPRAGLHAERQLARYATAGRVLHYGLQVQNRDDRVIAASELTDAVDTPLPTFDQFMQTVDPPHLRLNWYDRRIGYHRWSGILASHRIGVAQATVVEALMPGERRRIELSVRLLRRGVLHLSAIELACTDPLGLVRSRRRVQLRQKIIVLPRRFPVPQLDLPGSRAYQQGGVSQAASVGDSEEFLQLRDYRPGDPLQRLHWKSYARLGRPQVKEYQEEFFQRYALVLDTGCADGPQFEDAVALSASYVAALDSAETLIELIFAGESVYGLLAGRGQLGIDALLEALAAVQPAGGTSFERLAAAVMSRVGALSGVILVCQGFDSARHALVRALTARGVACHVLAVVPAATELGSQPRLPVAGRWLRSGHIEQDLGT